jgi:hypothetical protein
VWRERTKRVRSWATLALGSALALAVGCVAWAAVVYVSFLRLEVELSDACSRVDAVSRFRTRLAGHLVEDSGAFASGLHPAVLQRLETAVHRAERLHAAALLDDPALYAEFVAAQADLTAALGEVRSELRAADDPGARLLVEDLDLQFDGRAAALAEGLGRLDASFAAYRAAVDRFPGSLVAGVAGLEGPAPLEGVLPR